LIAHVGLAIAIEPDCVANVRIDRQGLLATGDCLATSTIAQRFADSLLAFPLVIEPK
jgi:hypothetical protein